jgi:hypothetical protein
MLLLPRCGRVAQESDELENESHSLLPLCRIHAWQ